MGADRQHRPALANANPNAHTQSHPDAYRSSNGHPYLNTHAYPDLDGNAPTDNHPHQTGSDEGDYSHSTAHAAACPNHHTHGHPGATTAEAHSYANANPYAHTQTNRYAYAHQYAYTNLYTDQHAYTHTDRYSHAHQYAHAHPSTTLGGIGQSHRRKHGQRPEGRSYQHLRPGERQLARRGRSHQRRRRHLEDHL